MRDNDSDRRTLDLTPFWKSGNAFHRSTDTPVRDFIKFQATYPEFVGLENLSVAERKARIQAKVDALYDPQNRRRGIPVRTSAGLPVAAIVGAQAGSVSGGAVRASGGAPPVRSGGAGAPGGGVAGGLPQAVFKAAALSVQAPLPEAPAPTDDDPEGLTALQRLDWFIRIRVKKFQLAQSFTILIFLGPVPEDAADYRTSDSFIGSHSEFVNSDPEHCANCKDSANLITEGFIDLDDSLERLGQGEKTEEEIEKYIHDQIHWRIQKVSSHYRLPLTAGLTGCLLDRWNGRACCGA